LNNIILLKDFKFRVDIINFFILGRYIEFIRRFLYNKYVNFNCGLKKDNLFVIKNVLRNYYITEDKLFSSFKSNYEMGII
jgi:hypothetical protein